TINCRRAPVLTSKDVLQHEVPSNPSTAVDKTPTKTLAYSESDTVQTLHNKSVDSTENPIPRLVPMDYDSDTDSQSSSDKDHADNDQIVGPPETPRLSDSDSVPTPPPTVGDVIGFTSLADAPESNSEAEKTPEVTLPSNSQSGSSRGRRRRRGGRKRRQRLERRNADGLVENTGSVDDQQPNSSQCGPSPAGSNPFALHPVVQLRAKRRACLQDPERIHSRPTLLQMSDIHGSDGWTVLFFLALGDPEPDKTPFQTEWKFSCK
ncbi:unnamed protein product, partial [Echinostoma caproni]|uniref:Death inducer-obliterator 1 n=1 Tax=Echinostoma caproni TaxID=27848 RepID=A0A182ZZC1_9TREM